MLGASTQKILLRKTQQFRRVKALGAGFEQKEI
jgi:hypothetical protein